MRPSHNGSLAGIRSTARSVSTRPRAKLKPNEFPTEYFRRKTGREERALTAAPSKAAQTLAGETMTQPTVEYAFAPPSASVLGVELRPVGPGQAHHVVVTTPVPASAKAKGVALTNSASVLTLEPRKPQRLGAQFEIAIEDEAIFPTLGTDLDVSASAAVANLLDEQIISGDGASPNLTGLFSVATDVDAAAAQRNLAARRGPLRGAC